MANRFSKNACLFLFFNNLANIDPAAEALSIFFKLVGCQLNCAVRAADGGENRIKSFQLFIKIRINTVVYAERANTADFVAYHAFNLIGS